MPAVVLFDLDGTLVDHDTAAATAIVGWAEREGWILPDLARVWDAVAERHFADYRARRLSFQGQRRARLREFLPQVGVDITAWDDPRFDEAFSIYDALYSAAWKPYPDAASTLSALPRTAVLSNGDQTQQEDKLRRTSLLDRVAAVFTSDGLGVAKPEPESFRAACAQLGVRPEDAVYVGDRVDVDAQAASAAGLRGVWLNRTGAAERTGVETIRSLDQLPALLGAAQPPCDWIDPPCGSSVSPSTAACSSEPPSSVP